MRPEQPRPFVDDQRQSAALGEVGERRRLDRRHEAGDAKVARMNLQQKRGRRPHRALVVGEPRAIRRPHLDDPGTRSREDLRDAKRAADLHQLTARDDDLAVLRQDGQGEQQGRRAVVRDAGALGAGERDEQSLEAAGAISPAAGREIELEVAGGGRELSQPGGDFNGQRCAAQIGVQEDSGGIQHAPQGRAEELL